MTAMEDAIELPSRYKYFKIGPGKYRANLLNERDAKQWMEEYVCLTKTNWRVFKTKSNTPHFICSLEYNCHHTSYRRVDPNENARGKSKNYNCCAKLKIAIKHTTKDTRKKDKYVKEGMPAFIAVTSNHNHSLTSGESLGYLRPISKVRDEFDTYFDSGLGITDSIRYHKSKLELKYGVGSVELANALLNPKYRTVSFWYNKWKTLNLRRRYGDVALEKIQENQKMYDNGIIVKFQENPFAVVVVTKVMQEVHSLPFSKHIVFRDSASSNRLFLNKQLKRIDYLQKDDVKKYISPFLYVVPSSENNGIYYEVDIQAGFCSCDAGKLGGFCKHQTAILHFFGSRFTNASSNTRRSMAKPAFDNNIHQPLSFYEPLVSEPSTSSDFLTESEEIISQQQNLVPNNSNNNEKVGKLVGANTITTSAKDSINFQKVVDLLLAKNSQFGTSTPTIKMLCQRLKQVKTSEAWKRLLYTAGSSCSQGYRQKSSIIVQPPLAMNRRKVGITRESKKIPLGRPASEEPAKKRLKEK